MFLEWQEKIEHELSGRQAYRNAERIAQFHRIQASTGYREAAHTVRSLLHREGIETELVSYPARFGERHLSNRSFQEWHCQSAELWIVGEHDKRIARFQEEEISVVQRSIATPPEGVTGELVVIDNAEDPKSYEGLDLAGKIALVRGNQFIIYDLAVEKHGAIGLVFDNLNEYPPIRTRLDMPDAIQYTSFWWYGDEKKAFGFAVSPRVGIELREMCQKGTVRLKAKVDAKLYEGEFENIEYLIRGKKSEEILLVSHLCHPYPGGQDNASGPGTLMEVMRALQRLITDGALPQPEISIRFLMMPEMTGTYAYFAQHPERIPLTIAALNLDMVGADQTKGGGPLLVEQPPMSTPTFVDRFAFTLLDMISKDASNFTGTSKYSTTHYLASRFSGGSDHYIIADPTIGIPCPMIIQWPDKHYHTTSDSPQNLDPGMMKRVGRVTAMYAYGLANGSEDDWLIFLMQDIAKRYEALREGLEWIMKKQSTSIGIEKWMNFYVNYEIKAYQQLEKYAQIRGFDRLAEQTKWACDKLSEQANHLLSIAKVQLQLNQLGKFIEPESKNHLNKDTRNEAWMNRIYKRTYLGPIDLRGDLERLSIEERIQWYQEQKALSAPSEYSTMLTYWIDGKRTLEEVLQLTEMETGVFLPQAAIHYIELCERLGLITQ